MVRQAAPLVAIGVASGFLAALFGVGGGVIVVPGLIGLAGFRLRRATATSLAAIGFTAVFGAARYGATGEVRWLEAALIGLPALAGVALGLALQRRIPAARLQLAFAGLVAAVGVKLLVS